MKTQKHIQAFIINLDNATERMKHMRSEIEPTAIPYTRIEAVYGPALAEPIKGFDEKRFKVLTGKVQKALFEAHPYETVAYEMYGLLNSYNNVGMGKIGFLKNETNRIDFLKNLKKIFNTGHIRYNNYKGEKLNKIAVLGGSGSFAIEEAKKKGADAFITADLKYHQFFQADGEILLIDIGHYESEQYTKNLIFDYLTKKLPNFAIALSKTKTNPVNYI